MKMFRLPHFVRTLRAQFLQTISLLWLIWVRRDLKEVEKKVVQQRSKVAYYQRRFQQMVGLGFSPASIHGLVHEYGVAAAGAATVCAIALRYNEWPKTKKLITHRKKMITQLTRPVTNATNKINKARRLRSVLCYPPLNLDRSLRRLVDGITLSRKDYSIEKFYDCLVHLMNIPDESFPPKPDMVGIERDPHEFEWADEEEVVEVK